MGKAPRDKVSEVFSYQHGRRLRPVTRRVLALRNVKDWNFSAPSSGALPPFCQFKIMDQSVSMAEEARSSSASI